MLYYYPIFPLSLYIYKYTVKQSTLGGVLRGTFYSLGVKHTMQTNPNPNVEFKQVYVKHKVELPLWTEVGVYQFGNHNVRIILDWDRDNGADIFMLGDGKGMPRIRLGCKGKQWNEVLGYLFHELFEMAYIVHCVRFEVSDHWNQDAAHYHFHFDHNMHSRICDQVGYLIADMIHEMARLFNERKEVETSRRRDEVNR
jgi:hypothetical protein